MIVRHQTRWPGALAAVALTVAAFTGCTGSGASDGDATPTASITTTTAPTVPVVTPPIGPIGDLALANVACLVPAAIVEMQEWSSCSTEEGIDLIGIEWIVDDVVHNEVFALTDGDLRFALQSTALLTAGERTAPWSVQYEIEDGTVIDFSSLGLGPTEADGWDPDAILDRWAQREATASELGMTN